MVIPMTTLKDRETLLEHRRFLAELDNGNDPLVRWRRRKQEDAEAEAKIAAANVTRLDRPPQRDWSAWERWATAIADQRIAAALGEYKNFLTEIVGQALGEISGETDEELEQLRGELSELRKQLDERTAIVEFTEHRQGGNTLAMAVAGSRSRLLARAMSWASYGPRSPRCATTNTRHARN
jgi:hypothetical protein